MTKFAIVDNVYTYTLYDPVLQMAEAASIPMGVIVLFLVSSIVVCSKSNQNKNININVPANN
jgi:hypothetical protein